MNGRNEVFQIIHQLKDACRRPLFTEICLDESMDANGYESTAGTSVERQPKPTLSPTPSSSVLRDTLSETDSQGPFSSTFPKRPHMDYPVKPWKDVSDNISY
jgi:hypothetical protein